MAPAIRRPRWPRLVVFTVAAVVAVAALGLGTKFAIDAYRGSLTLTGLSGDPTPITITVGGEALAIPGNMLRDPVARSGGTLPQADLVLHWPTLEGYSKALAGDFSDGSPDAPLVYATIAPRTVALDAGARLAGVYEQYFIGDPLPAPTGLMARKLSADSGYDGEIVYYGPDGPQRFVARCLPVATADIPATCLRDIAVGKNLTLLYRFNRDQIADWQGLDAGIAVLAGKITGGR